jgi:nitroimidazol reductase NimA-like FMN-containing flavoprotein (pyridoxamine 5'-phosphate oxidase superfamily)
MSAELRSVEQLSHAEAVRLLTGAGVGRVVFVGSGVPTVVPVAFAVVDDSVVLRTAAETRLAAAADGGVLAFEADDVDLAGRTGWSVVASGIAEVVTEPSARARIYDAVEPFVPGAHDLCIRLPLTVVTGRRVSAQSEPVAT